MIENTLAITLIILIACFSTGTTSPNSEGLSYDFYDKTCPQLDDIVRASLNPVFTSDPTSPAALLRLLFHDCQVQGCDASILIDMSNSHSLEPSEIRASKNFGIRKRESIDMLKSKVEVECPGVVSCADILVLAAREAVAISGGPIIRVPLGRRDSTCAFSPETANSILPSADIGVNDALGLFASHGMTTKEAVAIMGAHTLGITHCLNVVNRLYKPLGERASKMDPGFEVLLKLSCPEWITETQNTSFAFNDPSTFIFDNWYYKNSIKGRGILRIDSELPLNPKTAGFVKYFAANRNEFFQTFGSAFVKLSYAGVLTGSKGVIRSMCNSVN